MALQTNDGLTPRLNCHIIYVLRLEDDCWYVGWTTSFSFKKRMKDHWESAYKGALWTRKHKPLRVVSIDTYPRSLLESEVAKIEDAKTLEYARRHGLNNVRGGGYCQEYPDWPLDMGRVRKGKKKYKSNKQLREIAKAQRELRASAKLIK